MLTAEEFLQRQLIRSLFLSSVSLFLFLSSLPTFPFLLALLLLWAIQFVKHARIHFIVVANILCLTYDQPLGNLAFFLAEFFIRTKSFVL